jgi:hypothetical protein
MLFMWMIREPRGQHADELRRTGIRVLRALATSAAVIVFAGTSYSAEPEFRALANITVKATCHMEVCEWFNIFTASSMGTSPKGELYVLATKSWASDYRIQADDEY